MKQYELSINEAILSLQLHLFTFDLMIVKYFGCLSIPRQQILKGQLYANLCLDFGKETQVQFQTYRIHPFPDSKLHQLYSDSTYTSNHILNDNLICWTCSWLSFSFLFQSASHLHNLCLMVQSKRSDMSCYCAYVCPFHSLSVFFHNVIDLNF